MKQLPPILFIVQDTPTIPLTLSNVHSHSLRDKQCGARDTTTAIVTPWRTGTTGDMNCMQQNQQSGFQNLFGYHSYSDIAPQPSPPDNDLLSASAPEYSVVMQDQEYAPAYHMSDNTFQPGQPSATGYLTADHRSPQQCA